MDNTTHLIEAKAEVERLLRLHVEDCDDDGHQSGECVHCGDSWPCESYVAMSKILELLGGHNHTPEIATDGTTICSECATPISVWSQYENRTTGEVISAVRLTDELIRHHSPLGVDEIILFDEQRMMAVVNTIDKEDWGKIGDWLTTHDGYSFYDPLTFDFSWKSVS